MNKKDKLLKRFYSLPKDFTFDEMVSVFSCYGFHQENKGTTSGSRVILSMTKMAIATSCTSLILQILSKDML